MNVCTTHYVEHVYEIKYRKDIKKTLAHSSYHRNRLHINLKIRL